MNAFAASIEPHTAYLSARTSENFEISMSLSLEGIGALLGRENEYTLISSVVPGGPADKDGRLKAGDRITAGYFGASTGAASALRAAAFYGKDIKAVVSRGGRPDMALQDLHKVTAPTLLIVGGWDDAVIELNEKAYQKLKSERKLEIVPMATHLFEESGKLEKVAHISANWFAKYLQPEKIKQDV